jgi:Icc-related predicted phosphoesterase
MESNMTVVGISDIHGKIEYLQMLANNLKKSDLIIVSGDLTHFGKEKEAEVVYNAIKSINKNFLVVPGNCDFPQVHSFLQREDVNLHGRCMMFRDYALAGVGGSLMCPGLTPNEYTEEEFKLILDEIKEQLPGGKPVIFVTHQPPALTDCDLTSDGRHVGSHSIREFIHDVQPVICFSGHIHESRGIGSIGKIKVVNPGPLSQEAYATVDLGGGVKSIKIIKSGETTHIYP